MALLPGYKLLMRPSPIAELTLAIKRSWLWALAVMLVQVYSLDIWRQYL